MKKGLLTLLSFCLILVLAVSFSFPSYAAYAATAVPDTTVSVSGPSFYVYGEYFLLSDKKITFNADNVVLSYDVSFNLVFSGIADSSHGDYGRFYFTPVFSWNVSKPEPDSPGYYSIKCTGAEMSFQGQSAPFVLDGTSSGLYFDVRVIDQYSLSRMTVTCHFVVSLSKRVSEAYAFYAIDTDFKFGVKNARWNWYDSLSEVSDADLEAATNSINNNTTKQITNQTTTINNNITKQTQQQTTTLTTGFDNNGMENSNASLNSSLTDYDNKEGKITDASITYIDGASFIKPSSNATLLTSISFCTAWLQSLFVNLGNWSILVMVSLSLALGLMLIGWFKYR